MGNANRSGKEWRKLPDEYREREPILAEIPTTASEHSRIASGSFAGFSAPSAGIPPLLRQML